MGAIQPEQLAKDSEKSHQIALFAWAGLNQKAIPALKWLHAIPNANSHHMVAEGCRAGVSDIFLPLPMQTESAVMYAGLYIEMKKDGRQKDKHGGCSQDQLDFIDYAKKVGYKTAICYNWIEAKNVILEYLGGQDSSAATRS